MKILFLKVRYGNCNLYISLQGVKKLSRPACTTVCQLFIPGPGYRSVREQKDVLMDHL